jgi:fermentation-respiration switch protein FrsA (DUF1100 family)
MIGYEVVADGVARPWLTLVHGFSQNRRYFESALGHFAGQYRLLLIDLRGHGASAGTAGPFGIVEYAEDLERVMCASTRARRTGAGRWSSCESSPARRGRATWNRNRQRICAPDSTKSGRGYFF